MMNLILILSSFSCNNAAITSWEIAAVIASQVRFQYLTLQSIMDLFAFKLNQPFICGVLNIGNIHLFYISIVIIVVLLVVFFFQRKFMVSKRKMQKLIHEIE
ncbi:MAG: hypothetical protein MI922_14830, partial [Bacteroidales bacterium]|nr:hypothetical protein [Bacteroidales bacterium]